MNRKTATITTAAYLENVSKRCFEQQAAILAARQKRQAAMLESILTFAPNFLDGEPQPPAEVG